MPDEDANCPTGQAAHELAPLTDDTVPAPQVVACDAPASTTKNPAEAFVHTDRPDEFAIWPRGHALQILEPAEAAMEPALHATH